MAESNSENQPPRVTGGKDRPWHMRAWSGITVTGWWRALAKHQFRVSPTRIPMAFLLGCMSLMNSSLAILQRLVYGKRIATTELTEAPVFVLGHWRSGTTLLHELLVLDDDTTYPNTYACFSPNHFLISENWLKWLLVFFLPKQRPMDNMKIGWNLPQEDEWALCNMGLPSPYFKVMFPNLPMVDYDYQTLGNLSMNERSRWQQGLNWFLKCLTVRNPKRVVLKTPLHTFRIAALIELYPNAKFIHITRDPYLLFPSTIHTWKRMYAHQGLQVPNCENLEEEVLQTFTEMYDAFERDLPKVPIAQFYQLSYEDLTANPVSELDKLYEHFGMWVTSQTRQAWQAYAENNKSYEKNRHRLTDAQRELVGARWKAYFTKNGYSQESFH